ncbi:small secreted protein [Hypoxylon sp. FL1284]|nr:small secreted protein [Hypoxylon sp. FL1284]
MQFTSTILAALLSGTALAAPAPSAAKSAMADVAQWTIEGMKRVCDAQDTTCTWSFAVDTHTAAATPCSFTVKAGAKPASQTDSTAGTVCGPYTVTSGWSDQFGLDNAFTTLAVVDYEHKLIVWPAYTDKQLAGGAVVTPDLSFAPTTMSW